MEGTNQPEFITVTSKGEKIDVVTRQIALVTEGKGKRQLYLKGESVGADFACDEPMSYFLKFLCPLEALPD